MLYYSDNIPFLSNIDHEDRREENNNFRNQKNGGRKYFYHFTYASQAGK